MILNPVLGFGALVRLQVLFQKKSVTIDTQKLILWCPGENKDRQWKTKTDNDRYCMLDKHITKKVCSAYIISDIIFNILTFIFNVLRMIDYE